jgi:hypothetical protein
MRKGTRRMQQQQQQQQFRWKESELQAKGKQVIHNTRVPDEMRIRCQS